MDVLEHLSDLLAQRKSIASSIEPIVGKTFEKGHVGEFIASVVFDIQLEESGTAVWCEGIFRSGLLAGKSANVKWYAKRQGVLDINPDNSERIDPIRSRLLQTFGTVWTTLTGLQEIFIAAKRRCRVIAQVKSN